jgi:pimeloyl-ACP methyl ester carboxylesterase
MLVETAAARLHASLKHLGTGGGPGVVCAPMGFVTLDGTTLRYDRAGSGPPVLLVMGTGAPGRVWSLYQVPALTDAGFEVITFDNRGLRPADGPPGASRWPIWPPTPAR